MSYIGSKPANKPITSADIEDSIIVAADLAANSVDSSELVDGSIDTSHLGASQVTTAKIAADNIVASLIADDAIDSEHYTDGSIDTAHINDLNVTTAKIAADAVTSAKLADDAVVTANIVDLNVTTAKIAADAITGAKIADDAIGAEHIDDNAIGLAAMAGGTDGNIISYDASGDPVAIATGNDGQVLTSTGAGSPPAFEDAAGGVSLLGTIESSSDTSTIAIDGVMDNSSYAYYIVAGLFKSAGNGVTIEARFRDGGAALTASNYNYSNALWQAGASSVEMDNSASENHADIIDGVGTRTFSFYGHIFPAGTIANMGLSICDWTGKISKYDGGSRAIRKLSGIFEFVNSTVPDGFQISNQTSNFEDYEMRIYGVTR